MTDTDLACVYPHCGGKLHTGESAGYCLQCRLPVLRCRNCRAWNRTQAAFCAQCGVELVRGEDLTLPSPPALGSEPARSEADRPIPTAPHAAHGFLWALSDEGSLFRINPFGLSGRQIEVRTRFWAGSAPAHAFTVRDLDRPTLRGEKVSLPRESSAIVALRSELLTWGLVSQRSFRFTELREGETILPDARDRYQMVEAMGSHLFCLSELAGETSLLRVQVGSGDADRLVIPAAAKSAVCGPALAHGQGIVWTADRLFTLANPAQPAIRSATWQEHALPPGVALWTAPSDDGRLRLPLGRSPAIVSGARLCLPCYQFGEPALLQALAVGDRWVLSVIPITADGVLTGDAAGNPLLSARTQLLICPGDSFRPLIHDPQISDRFTAFHASPLAVFFSEDSFGGRSRQWLKAHRAGSDLPVDWALYPDQMLKDASGFYGLPGSLTAHLLIEDRLAHTEFVSWHD